MIHCTDFVVVYIKNSSQSILNKQYRVDKGVPAVVCEIYIHGGINCYIVLTARLTSHARGRCMWEDQRAGARGGVFVHYTTKITVIGMSH